MKKRTKLLIFLIILVLIIMAEANLLMIRALSHKELDDIHPDIPCSKECIQKADIIWVIPKFNDKKISDNQTWCMDILKLNKEIGLHGLTHEYREFANETKENEIKEAIEIFEDCFKFKPRMFKAPQLKLSKENAELIKQHNMTVYGKLNAITHKVYHCNDTGLFSNEFIEMF